MKIIKVETLEQLEKLYNSKAITWEGLVSDDFNIALQTCGCDGAEGYLTTGKVMNKLCKLTGNNAYPKDLNIFSIKNFKGIPSNYGAKCINDIIDNNATRENYHPFKK